MDAETRSAIYQVWSEAHAPDGLPFPKAVERLLNLGVERYHIDYVASTVTTYVGRAADRAEIAAYHTSTQTFPWDAAKVAAAIKRVQAGETSYSEFSKEMIEAGVTNYFAYLEGQKVIYMGALGDVHTELFPRKD